MSGYSYDGAGHIHYNFGAIDNISTAIGTYEGTGKV